MVMCFQSPLVYLNIFKVSKGDTNGKVTNSQLDSTNGSQDVSSFQPGYHKVHINRHKHRHSKRKTEEHKISTKEVPPWNGQ